MELHENNKCIHFIKVINIEILFVALLTYFSFHIIEYFFSGFISDFFNINILLIIIIISGLISFGLNDNEVILKKDNSKKQLLMYMIFSLITAIIIYINIKSIGVISIVIALLAGIFIYLIISNKEI